MKVGSIVFGPLPTKTGSIEKSVQTYQAITGSALDVLHPCNCIGPQPGQTKCPCALRRESEMGKKMGCWSL